MIVNKIENILHEDITRVEYYNSIEEYNSIETNYLKICTNYCNFILLYDRKINNIIHDQEIIGLPLEQAKEVINRKWLFGKDDIGEIHKYYDSIKEKDDFEDIKLTYRKDSYVLNQETEENDLSKSFVATRKDGSTLEVAFYYNNKGFEKYDIKSKGQIMLLSDDAPNSPAFEFFDYDCYPVERWTDKGDNLYLKNNYAFIYNTRFNYIVAIDIDEIKSIDCKKEKEDNYEFYSFEIYTNDGSMISYSPLIEYGDKEDIIETFLIINPNIIINKI